MLVWVYVCTNDHTMVVRCGRLVRFIHHTGRNNGPGVCVQLASKGSHLSVPQPNPTPKQTRLCGVLLCSAAVAVCSLQSLLSLMFCVALQSQPTYLEQIRRLGLKFWPCALQWEDCRVESQPQLSTEQNKFIYTFKHSSSQLLGCPAPGVSPPPPPPAFPRVLS